MATRVSAPAQLTPQRLYVQAAAFALVSVGALLLAGSYIVCPNFTWMESYCADTHYKYLVPLLIPVTAWFAIANWVGWTYFRFA